MYINFWYPIATSKEVSNEAPARAKVLGHMLVAYRDSDGVPHVMADTCVHRGGALGEGKVIGDNIQCPYHGWQYNAAGKCTHIPVLPDDAPPARAKIDAYPTEERYGIVFAFLGDLPESERPPLFEIEEYDSDGWRATEPFVYEVKAYFERVIENGLDPAHNEFVHPKQGSPGMKQDFKKTPIEINPLGDYGSGFMVPFSLAKPEDSAMNKEAVNDGKTVYAGSGHFGPGVLITWLHFNEDNKFHQYSFEAPVDETTTRNFLVNTRCFILDPSHDQGVIDTNWEVAEEDIVILEKLYPQITPDTLNDELLIMTDTPVIKYREFLKDWENKGWKINRKQLIENRGVKATAIPCPDRRTEKNWVTDSVALDS